MIAAIRDFPMPVEPTITDIRAWFGVVNQLAPFIANNDMMSPFQDLLKSKDLRGKKVFWDEILQTAFENSKKALCEIASKGLTYYDLTKETVLVTDWSKVGIGFVLLQKHCNCATKDDPLCCEGGWKPAYCNSRTLTPEEANYVPIEGEGLAVTWALKKARLFLLGHPKFTVYVDHNPLVRIFGSKPLSDIDNIRLQKQKEKTLGYHFDIKYLKGIKNHANTFSRYPVNQPDQDDITEAREVNNIALNSLTIATSMISLTIDSLKQQAASDNQYQKLASKIKNNTFAESFTLEEPLVKEYYNVRDRLRVVDDLITYSFDSNSERIVVPRQIRQELLKNLHSANQGSTSMLARARRHYYWPGMDRDVESHVDSCERCREMSPSKPKEPLIPTPTPDYPFQKVVADLFEVDGYHYLVYCDRLTAFAELAHFPVSTTSYNIINSLREFYHRWGVAEEISLDGAMNLQSSEIVNWLVSWGTVERKSSAYYPQSNGRAEAGVKSLKRMMQGNIGPKGSLHTDNIAKALLQYRNTPLRDINKSPAELALGRELRDTLPLPQKRYEINPHWARMIRDRERSMSQRNDEMKQKYDEHAKPLSELSKGDKVLCQNTRSKKWDRSGVIMEVGKFRQYTVKMDGSGRLSHRNRRHLQKIQKTIPVIPHVPSAPNTNANNDTPIEDTGNNVPQYFHNNTQEQSVTTDTPITCIDNTTSPASAEDNLVLRRSRRTHREPNRYCDESCKR